MIFTMNFRVYYESYDNRFSLLRLYFMKACFKFISMGIAILPIFLAAQPSNAEGKPRFACGSDQGVPATLAISSDGTSVPVIRYVSNAFESAGFSAQKRCEEISARFQYYNEQREIDFMTIGKINGQNVICVTRQEGGDCSRDLKSEGLLITTRPGVNPRTTLAQLIDVRLQAGSALSETEERPYINTRCLISAGKDQEAYDSCAKGAVRLSSPSSAPSKVIKAVPASPSKPALW